MAVAVVVRSVRVIRAVVARAPRSGFAVGLVLTGSVGANEGGSRSVVVSVAASDPAISAYAEAVGVAL